MTSKISLKFYTAHFNENQRKKILTSILLQSFWINVELRNFNETTKMKLYRVAVFAQTISPKFWETLDLEGR